MLRFLILRKLASVEREIGVSVDYVRHILRVSLGAFFRFAKVFPLAQYRRSLPLDMHVVAGIVAARDEDCGTCVQAGLNLARMQGVDSAILRAVIDREPDRLPESAADAYRFAEAVVTHSSETDRLRDLLRERYGEAALVELALAIAASRVFPVTKRALGYATSCANIQFDI